MYCFSSKRKIKNKRKNKNQGAAYEEINLASLEKE